MKYHHAQNKGFTLIELLVVIAIIGILSSVVLVSVNSARLKARNALRVSNLKQVASALEMYYSDYGVYPATVGWNSQCAFFSQQTAVNVIPGLVPKYLPVLPVDPANPSFANAPYLCIAYVSNGTDYKVIDVNTELTSAQIVAQFGQFADPYRNGGNQALCPGSSIWWGTMAVWTKGAQCW